MPPKKSPIMFGAEAEDAVATEEAAGLGDGVVEGAVVGVLGVRGRVGADGAEGTPGRGVVGADGV
jgi:hypothetical protein